MLPKITFRNSWVYDRMLEPLRDKKFRMPDRKVFLKEIRSIQKEWTKYEKPVLRELSKVTRLPWKESEITVYVTAGVIPFSDPLTMNLAGDLNRKIDVLVHELVHRIVSHPDNFDKIASNWRRLMRKYQKEDLVTSIHVPIHAVHEHILRKLFDEKRLEAEKNWGNNKLYKRAWDIVEDEGYENVIEILTKGLK